MNEQAPEGDVVRVVGTDAETIDGVQIETDKPGEEGVKTILGGIATSLTKSLYERVDADPEYLAIKAKFDVTPWFRLKERRRLGEQVRSSKTDAFERAINSSFGTPETEAIESRQWPDNEA